MVECFMGVSITPISRQRDNGKWKSVARLQAKDGPPVIALGWPLEHGTEEEANVTAMATAKRQIHRGQWQEQQPTSEFQPLG